MRLLSEIVLFDVRNGCYRCRKWKYYEIRLYGCIKAYGFLHFHFLIYNFFELTTFIGTTYSSIGFMKSKKSRLNKNVHHFWKFILFIFSTGSVLTFVIQEPFTDWHRDWFQFKSKKGIPPTQENIDKLKDDVELASTPLS